MEIRDADSGRFVRLEPVGYQFPDIIGVEFDSDWLVIRGSARSNEEEWAFEDPSLLVDEALRLGSWMRDAGSGRAAVLVPDEDGHTWPTTETIEPNLGFGVVGYGRGIATIRAFLWLESAPPSTWDGRTKTDMDFFIDLTTSLDSLNRAADEWDAALAEFPKRT
ncbi:hypothetical protein [Leifsonia sp. LS-T14]|uniref:WapI family immunity protein n=1 Tax=unclassified Leifsonia TaxID=2663824 RepID=UPI0035A6B062